MASPDEAATAAADAVTFASLPHAITLHIFAQLPPHTRLRAAGVCRAWRGALSERARWTALDLSPGSGVPRRYASEALLWAAARRAGDSLQSLDVSGCPRITPYTLFRVVQAHRGALRVLRACNERATSLENVERILLVGRDALRKCHVTMSCRGGDVVGVLGGGGQFAPLQVQQLNVSFAHMVTIDTFVDEIVPALAAHAPLTRLALQRMVLTFVGPLDAVVDTALARSLTFLSICECRLVTASLPSLARLLRASRTLTTLILRGEPFAPAIHGVLFAGAAQTQPLADALRGNITLTSLTLHEMSLWDSVPAATALLGALTGHASIAALHLSGNRHAVNNAAAGVLITALISANAPALTHLDVSDCGLTDASMQPILLAAARSTRLRSLHADENYLFNAAFAHDTLMPALRESSSLRTLQIGGHRVEHAREVEEMVAARRRSARARLAQ
jgi:hypothetical protein